MPDTEDVVGAREFFAKKHMPLGKKTCLEGLGDCEIFDSFEVFDGCELFDGLK